MTRAGWAVSLGVIITILAGLLYLRSRSLEIVHSVVVSAVIQKAPQGYPVEKVRNLFNAQMERSRRAGKSGEYLEHLLRISQRLEKVQRLDTAEVDSLLGSIETPNQE